jgi:hypothetical protein
MKHTFLATLLLITFTGVSKGVLDQNPGSVQGVVTDNYGSVLPGAAVVASKSDQPGIKGFATTDPNGNYTINGLLPGYYQMKFSASGYQEATSANVAIYSNQTATQNATLEASTLASLGGTVTDANGATVAKALVTATNNSNAITKSTQTNDDGQYSLSLPSGTYSISVEGSGFKKAVVEDVKVSVSRRQTVDIQLAPGNLAAITVGGVDNSFLTRRMSGLTKPAGIQSPGVFQLELGYSGDFHRRDFHATQRMPLSFSFVPVDRLLLEANLEAIKASGPASAKPEVSYGDTRLGFQVVALHQSPGPVSLAFAYRIKLPTAPDKLGSGRVDHAITFLLSKSSKSGRSFFDFNSAMLVNGRANMNGWTVGGSASFAYSLILPLRKGQQFVGLKDEVSIQSKDDQQPKGAYLGAMIITGLNRHISFNVGSRFGLNHDAPRFGIFAGMTVTLSK